MISSHPSTAQLRSRNNFGPGSHEALYATGLCIMANAMTA
jgi:hypothetical protein